MTQFTITNETVEEHLVYVNALHHYSILDSIRRLVRNYEKHSNQSPPENKLFIDEVKHLMNDFILD